MSTNICVSVSSHCTMHVSFEWNLWCVFVSNVGLGLGPSCCFLLFLSCSFFSIILVGFSCDFIQISIARRSTHKREIARLTTIQCLFTHMSTILQFFVSSSPSHFLSNHLNSDSDFVSVFFPSLLHNPLYYFQRQQACLLAHTHTQ